jgi:hypothetical protein
VDGIYLVGVPEDTMSIIKMLSAKLGKSHAEIIAEALARMAKAVLAP